MKIDLLSWDHSILKAAPSLQRVSGFPIVLSEMEVIPV